MMGDINIAIHPVLEAFENLSDAEKVDFMEAIVSRLDNKGNALGLLFARYGEL